jgi:glycosyltransferase involved in cell wall biosynthesis
MNRFKIVMSLYNCFETLPLCFESIASQRYRNFDVVVVDDASTEPGQWEWIDRYCRHQGWLALRNEQNLGPLAGLVRATEAAECDDDDIIVHIDGDDRLAHADVLGRLGQIYSRGEVDLTYGQYQCHPNGVIGHCAPYDPAVIAERSYRTTFGLWSHLRTFKAFLWNAIDDRDLRAPQGGYFRYAIDRVFMNPLMEMVGHRFRVVDEVLYIYNCSNPRSDMRCNRFSHLATKLYLCNMPRYPVHERCR